MGHLFDMVSQDPLFGTKTWEEAESTLQKETASLAIGKAGLKPEEIRIAFAGRSACPDHCLFLWDR